MTTDLAPSRVRDVALTDLKPAAWNPRRIKDDRLKNLAAAIEADPGFLRLRPVLAMADGTIYAGNQRYRAAKLLGWKTVPAIVEDVPIELARERAIRDNNEWGEWENAELAALVAQVEADGAVLDQLGLPDTQLERMLRANRHTGNVGLTDPDDVPDEPMGRAKRGDLWILGDHRLVCGDATDPDDFGRLMASGERAEMMWTDPPYGVAIGDKNKMLDSMGKGSSNRITENLKNLKNDTLDEGGLRAMLDAAFALAESACLPGAAWYVACPPGPLFLEFGAALHSLSIWHQTIQWVKNNSTFPPMGVDYRWQNEPVLYGWLPGAAHRYRGGRKQTTVWEIDRPARSADHPTMKPIELVARAIRNSSDSGDVVLDPFMGSGTTLIAAEQEGRRGFGLELDPHYVDVIVARWEKFTGRQAALG